MIKFQKLEIQREHWGKDKGKLKGKLDISTESGELSLNLNDELADKLMQTARSAMVDAVEHTANKFIYEITTAIPETKFIENVEDNHE